MTATRIEGTPTLGLIEVRGSDRAVIALPSEVNCAMSPQLEEAAPRAFLALTDRVDVPELMKTRSVAVRLVHRPDSLQTSATLGSRVA